MDSETAKSLIARYLKYSQLPTKNFTVIDPVKNLSHAPFSHRFQPLGGFMFMGRHWHSTEQVMQYYKGVHLLNTVNPLTENDKLNIKTQMDVILQSESVDDCVSATRELILRRKGANQPDTSVNDLLPDDWFNHISLQILQQALIASATQRPELAIHFIALQGKNLLVLINTDAQSITLSRHAINEYQGKIGENYLDKATPVL